MNKVNTLKEVLDDITTTMLIPLQTEIKNTKWEDLIIFHSDIGRQIRNKYLLWDGNINLAKDMGLPEGCHADEVSQAIIEALWKKLNKGE